MLLHLSQYVSRAENLVVVNEDGCTHNPLPVELAPDGFSPSCVGNCEMEAFGLQIMPERSSGEVSEGVGVVVNHHLWLAARTAGEIHNHVVLCTTMVDATQFCYSGVSRTMSLQDVFFGKSQPTFWYNRTDADAFLNRWTIWISRIDMFNDFFVAASNYRFDVGFMTAVNDVVVKKLEC